LQPIGKRAESDDQCQFRITDVPAGEYTLTVSYVGLSPFTSAVKVAARRAANMDAVLNYAGVTERVVVSAERVQGEAEAINGEPDLPDPTRILQTQCRLRNAVESCRRSSDSQSIAIC
jgi:hypothetical protein